MRRLISHPTTAWLFSPLSQYRFHKQKMDLPPSQTHLKQSLLHKKSFPQIISIIKNPNNPYPKNSAYFYTILGCILDQSNDNPKIMIDHGQAIHLFLQQIMDRIKFMSTKELSEILALHKYRPKALRFDKEFLITMHVRFETRINELIEINRNGTQNVHPEQILTMEDLRNQIQGLFHLKKNTTILSTVLKFSYNMLLKIQNDPASSPQQIAKQKECFFSIIEAINENLDDTIDQVRESIYEFIIQNHRLNQLPKQKQLLRMIIKCKFYKNFPIVRNENWVHEYMFGYLKDLINNTNLKDIEEFISVLKSVTWHTMHVEPQSREGFVQLVDQGYKMAKQALLAIHYDNQKEQMSRQVNTISHQIKLIPSYLYLINFWKINTVDVENGNKVDNKFVQKLIEQIKPIIKKFILCYFEQTETVNKNGKESLWLTESIDKNIEILNNIITSFEEPQKLLLKNVENLLNTVTVFKDYNIINVDPQFALLLVETQIIYCVLCRNWITDEVRYLRLLEHAVFVIGELNREIQKGNPKTLLHLQRFNRIKTKLEEELSAYDNMQKTYKQFTVLRLVSILKCINMHSKYLGEIYDDVKIKKPNIYVETLSRTMLKSHNYSEVIETFGFMVDGKIPMKEIELGRVVFLSSKEPQFLRYWIYTNRKAFLSKICFCRRIINNIVSIIRMDNLQINRNSIQLLSQIVIQNKLNEVENHSGNNYSDSANLKKILCNNFSILFRYSKMDLMIDDLFIVHKNIATIFKNAFSHIQLIKILTFSTYLSEEQSIFYINRQNKNALFKYIVMLMKKFPYSQKNKLHYLLGKPCSQQKIMLQVTSRIIQQYWPQNKLTNKGMPFYCQFLMYFLQTNQLQHLTQNENTTFLILKEILLDFKKAQTNSELKNIISRLQHNYEKLHFVTVFENLNQINNAFQNLANSMGIAMEKKIFRDFASIIQTWIKREIDHQKIIRAKNQPTIHSQWKPHEADKHLVNLMIIQKSQNLDFISDYQILSLMTINILAYGSRDTINQNMQLLIRRLLKINPISAKLNLSQESSKKKFPFELFKILLSNINIYTENRQKRQLQGKEMIADDLSQQKICEWLIKCLLTYAREIENNEEIDTILRYLHSWNVDILGLIRSKFLNPKINLANLCTNYFSVEILAWLWGQNIIRFNKEQSTTDSELSNEKIILYIKTLLKQMHETHLMNNYGIYFQEEGEYIMNIIKALLIGMNQTDKNPLASKQVQNCLKEHKDLTEKFTKISNQTFRFNKSRITKKYSETQNLDLSYDVGLEDTKPIRFRSKEKSQLTSKNLKTISTFSQILDIITLINLGKLSVKNLAQEHSNVIKGISSSITKRQNALLLDSELTYFIDTEPLLETKSFQDFGLKLYIRKTPNSNGKLTAYYLINQKQSMLYDFSSKKRKRLIGEEQLTIDLIEALINLPNGMEGETQTQQIEIKVLPNHLNKIQLKKIFST